MLLASFGIAAVNARATVTSASHYFDSVCYSADSYSVGQIAQLTTITGATNEAGISWREQVHLPAVPASAIALVSDSTICAHALRAFNQAAQFDEGPAPKLYLFSVGNMYVATNPNFPSGEWTQHLVFDSTLTFKAAYLK
jgi:hypothetical protein